MICMKPGLLKTNFIFEASFSKTMKDHDGVRIKSCCEKVLNMASNRISSLRLVCCLLAGDCATGHYGRMWFMFKCNEWRSMIHIHSLCSVDTPRTGACMPWSNRRSPTSTVLRFGLSLVLLRGPSGFSTRRSSYARTNEINSLPGRRFCSTTRPRGFTHTIALSPIGLSPLPSKIVALPASSSTSSSSFNPSSSPSGMDDAAVIARTQAWIHNMVIRIPLCPFAEKVVQDNTVRYVVVRARRKSDIIAHVLEEARALVETPEDVTATTIVLAPDAFVEDFSAFYETERFLEASLEASDLQHVVLLAAFHPQYTFGGGLSELDPIHFEKRSPFPVFNLLRAERVWAYANEGLTEKIADRNEAALAAIGIDEVRRRFTLSEKEVERYNGGKEYGVSEGSGV